MNVGDIMTKPVRRCGPQDSMERAAHLMWEGDCGALPVVDENGTCIGMITDRDVCMAAYTQGRTLADIPVSRAASTDVFSIRASETVEAAEALMREHRVHRLPVVDHEGKLAGILSLNDLARHVHGGRKHDGLSGDGIARTLSAICGPRAVSANMAE